MSFNFNKWNTALGWLTFFIALIVYSLTVEPTMSFWDCGEYIATAANLEVGHPPGAPLYQMIGAFFAMFALDKQHIALMVNMMSVFSSAFTILFLFWSTSIILRKVISGFAELNKTNSITILGSAFVGALAFTFSDSFWYNAVEAEVYAMATLFISLLFWLGLRWEEEMHTERGNKWLLIISLVVGLSFGVHFMALLTIPSIGFLYYFKNYKNISVKSFIIANVVVVAVLLFIFKLLLPWTMVFFGTAEVFMVNSLGLPFDSGTIFVILLLIALFYFGLKYTHEKGKVLYNTLILCVLFIMLGFSTWMMLPIRANANTPINENKPSDAREVLAYYNREQYGVNPLFYGPQFSDTYAGLDEDNPYTDEKPNYERDYKKGEYVIVNNYKNGTQNSDDNHKTILPRMWSTEHAENYMKFTNVLNFSIKEEYSEEQELTDIVAEFRASYSSGKLEIEDYEQFLKAYGQYLNIEKPTTIDNLTFMVQYQFGYMYWRYLMWNFVGRQNDKQGEYTTLDGNWISGINFLDGIRLGSQENLPAEWQNNKGRNTYFFLPFIIGLIGFFFHLKKDIKGFYIVLALFLFTGIALKIYLNERPFEPRERDYALVGSFYVFAIWIGIGVYAIFDFLKAFIKPKIAAPVVITACLFAAPILMATQNWDDHDRSGKCTAVSSARAYLDSCDKNALLFTIGDNDTFPIWYLQEIEGYRTDVRIVNTSLLMTDWYIDQMKAKAYESEPVPISFSHKDYVDGKRDYLVFDQKTESRLDVKEFFDFVSSDDPRTLIEMKNGQMIQFYPSNKIRIPVDKNRVIANKVVSPKYNDSIVPYIDVDIKGDALYKNRLMMLDIVRNNNWKRPIYFSPGAFADDDYIWMKEYLQLNGMVYKLVPVKTPIDKEASGFDMGSIDADKMYNIMMKLDWGNGESTKIYHDPETRKNSISYRTNLTRLMNQLIAEGKNEKAKKIIELALTKLPLDYYEFYSMVDPFADGYYKLGETQKARTLLKQLEAKYQDELKYFSQTKSSEQNENAVDIITNIERYRGLLEIMKNNKDNNFYNTEKAIFNSYNKRFERFGRDME
ncbi:protein O-mannosyl-transferase family [Flavobacterium sp.]|uniref:protein O-mannosyl-transferase family n=1 Tax=Flavobacterium sp. TaxID=239 RepID=UPI00375323E2